VAFSQYILTNSKIAEAKFLDEVQTIVLRVFFLAIHSPLYSVSLRFLFLQTIKSPYTLKEKGVKPDKKSYHLPYVLRNLYRNLKSDNSQEYAQEPQ
jgi:hypothetical protein